jgi:hypothetical protein
MILVSARVTHRKRMKTIGIAVAALVLALTTNAAASPSSKLVYIRGAGAEACPDEAALRKAVAQRLGYDPFFPSAQKTVVADVTRAPGSYHAKVQIVGDGGALRGARELTTKGDDCTELVSAIALAISIAIDDIDAEERNAEPPTAPAVAEEPEPTPPAEPAPPPPPPPVTFRSKRVQQRQADLSASIGPTLSFGTAPAAAVGASLAATLGYGFVAARASFRAELPASDSFSPGGTVSAHSFMGTLAACLRAALPFFCAGGGVGAISTTTSGIARGSSDIGPLVAVVGTAGVRLPLGGSYLEPFADGMLNLMEERVDADRRRIYTLPRFGGVLGVHFGWQIF